MIRDIQRMQTRVPKAGRVLRRIREERGLTVRDVNLRSRAIAKRLRNPDYALALSALWEIEAEGKVPHLYRLASLAKIYGRSFDELLGLYKVGAARRRKRRA